MNDWKVVSQIALFSGIAFIIFAAIAAFIRYQAIILEYSKFVSASFVQINIISTMLPYIALAFVSLIIATISSRAFKEATKKDNQTGIHSESGSTI